MGTTVPTKVAGTPNGGFLWAVPTNLSEQTTIYNSATRALMSPSWMRDYTEWAVRASFLLE